MKKLQLVLCLLLFGLMTGFAQKGKLAVSIVDGISNETIPFANVFIKEIGTGFSTDYDGKHLLEIEAGSYTFEVTYIGYEDQLIENVVIVSGETKTLDIVLKEAGETFDEVVIVGKQSRSSENAIIAIQRKSSNVVDGISSQAFKRVGDSNAASAIKRVTGVSIEGGKYVFVRGLGDRYTKTTLNGMDIPGLDPDKNSIQMDIFPTNIMDNIMVNKTFSPNLPGDFTGGVVNIVTKDFVEEKTGSVSLGISYNPSMHLKDNFISANGSSTDWLGFDDGKRSLRLNKNQYIPAPISDPTLTTITTRFSGDMATFRTNSGMNYSSGFSFGNQMDFKGGTFGFNTAANLKNSTKFFEGATYNNYIKSSDKEEMDLLLDRTTVGDLGVKNVLLNGMLGATLKFKKHTFVVNALHIQNGVSRAGFFERETIIRNSNTIIRDNIEYTQNAVSNVLVRGKHKLGNDFNVAWKLSPTLSRINDKDIKVSSFRLDDEGLLSIQPSEGAQPRRLFRDLNEINLSARLDLDKSWVIGERDVKLSGGLYQTYKERDYKILNYLVSVKGQNSLNLTGDPNELFMPENVWTPATGVGTYIIGNFEPTNSYLATQNTFATYLMTDFDITKKLSLSTGVRMEHFKHNYTGQNNTGSVIYDNEEILNNLDFLPAANLIYKVTDESKIRTSYSRTLARPSFKEASIAQIYDAISDITFIGNIDLVQTNIDNYDLRLESYQSGGQMIAVSGFYKRFVNPIELVAFSAAAPEDLQPRNVGDSKVLGVEFEFRKNLEFLNEKYKAFSLGTNVTIVDSKVQLDKSPGGEFESRQTNAREGEAVFDHRPMQGQAPYIVNAYLNYGGRSNGFDANLSYNVQGESLAIVGIGLNPDVYTRPFHNLSAKASKAIGSYKMSLGVSNILGSENIKEYKSYGSAESIFQLLRPQRTINLSMSYTFR